MCMLCVEEATGFAAAVTYFLPHTKTWIRCKCRDNKYVVVVVCVVLFIISYLSFESIFG